MIKERLKGLLALVLAGATALTTTTAVSAAEGEASTSLEWSNSGGYGGYVFNKTDAVAEATYQDYVSDYNYIDANIADISADTGVEILNNDFYSTETYSIGWGEVDSGFYYDDYYGAIIFPNEGYYCATYPLTQNLTNEMVGAMGDNPNSNAMHGRKVLVFNSVAEEFTIDYYDIFGNDTGKDFVFSDGKQLLDGKEIFGEGGENKKYILEYNDGDVEFTLNFSKDYDSAWKLVTDEWSKDEYRGKTFDSSKLSLHRKANFSLNSSTAADVTPRQIEEIKSSITKPESKNDLWLARYGYYGIEYLSGDQLADYLDKYNESKKLTIFNTGSDIYLRNGTVEQGREYSWENGELNRKTIKKIPYDLSQDENITIPEYNEIEWNLWKGYDASGALRAEEKLDSDRKDEFALKDIKKSEYPLIEYKFVPIVYSVPVDGADMLKVTVDDKEFPTDGGDYLFTYGDSVSKVVKNGEELWTEIAAVAADYDSAKAKLAKIQPITSAALNVKVPAIGGIPADAEAASANFTVTDTKWNPEDSVFKANKEYTVTATLTPALGYAFSADTTATVNGKPADADLNADGTLTVSYKFSATDKNTITSAEVTVTAPEFGKTPAATAEVPANVNYTVKSVSWNPSETFKTGVKYTVSVVLEPGADHEFSANTTAKVNGKNAEIKLNADGTLTVSYTFAEIAKNEIYSAEVTVTAPEEGKTPENTAELPAAADYTLKSVSWNTDKEFTTGTEYTVTVVLAPGADHKFSADATATVNGSNAEAKLNSDGTLTVTYTFDKLKDEIDKELEKENPVIKIPDGEPIPEDVIKKIKEKGKEVEIDYGDYSWIIKPGFDPGFVPKPIDLSLRKVGEKDWATVVNNVTGHKYKMQIDIAYTGNFGFTAYLVLDLSEGMKNAPAGDYYANLYQIVGNKLEWNGYSKLEADENGKWIAQLEFTHASEWLITIDSEINPGSDTKADSSSSSSVIGSKTNLARTIKSVGWTKITDEIKNSSAGSTISITLNDETTMPADALQAAIDKGVKLVMDAGFGRTWTIDGKTAVPGKYIDLSISGVNVGIPEAAYADILCSDSRQLKLNARLLNFTAQLTAFIGNDNIGQNAALYSYNEETGKLVFQDISVVDKNGNVIFDIKCGGRYFIALGSEVTSPYYLCGDVNGDGVVNAIDAAAILKNAVYGYPLDKRCGDTNGDGEVNAHDALPILHYVVGDVKILPVKDGELND